MSSQLAAARSKLQEQTPAFTVLEPARLAEWHFAPKKSFIAIAFAFLGGIGACLWLLYKLNGAEIMNWFKSEEE